MLKNQNSSELKITDLVDTPNTFMGVPFSQDLSQAKAAILGVPFDCGLHPVRIGSRYAPHSIREQSSLVRPFQPPHIDFNLLEALKVVDCGNVRLTPSVIDESYTQIEQAVTRILEANVIPVTMGGDGAVTLPQLRAVHRKHPDLVVLHIDAHTDNAPGKTPDTYDNATTFSRAAEEQLLDPTHSIHLGIRGTQFAQGVYQQATSSGYELIDFNEILSNGFDDIIQRIHEKLGDRPVYLCFDMDFFDPSCAPGVCTPTWGGASAREGLQLLQALKGLNFVAFDVNTVSPPHDVGGMTSYLAANVMFECLILAHYALEKQDKG